MDKFKHADNTSSFLKVFIELCVCLSVYLSVSLSSAVLSPWLDGCVPAARQSACLPPSLSFSQCYSVFFSLPLFLSLSFPCVIATASVSPTPFSFFGSVYTCIKWVTTTTQLQLQATRASCSLKLCLCHHLRLFPTLSVSLGVSFSVCQSVYLSLFLQLSR